MPRVLFILITLGLLGMIEKSDHAQAQTMSSQALIESGNFEPLYDLKQKSKAVKIARFKLDITPVTNRNFIEFLAKNPQWNKGNIAAALADQRYLEFLAGHKTELTESELEAPVTYVSWFAAQEYCKWRGARLPTLLEWEYAAAASENKKNASKDPKFVQKLLAWYGKPNQTKIQPVKHDVPNIWGVYDMHSLVWEWVADFNSVFVAGDNRREGDDLKNVFCASGALSSNDRANYAAFMRYALRSSLKGNYSLSSLGFRCASSIN